MPSPAFHSLDAVAAHLPFHLSDIEAANATFVRWWQERTPAHRRTVDIWTYCFVRRYFLVKFVKEPPPNPSDLDELVERTFQKIERNRETIRQPERYASWVSVICKNTYLNYVRRRHRLYSLNEDEAPEPAADPPPPLPYDAGVLMSTVLAAIERLPNFLREVAYLRFVKACSYQEIEAHIDKPLPILRSYVNKAARQLRQDPHLLALLEEPLPDPGKQG